MTLSTYVAFTSPVDPRELHDWVNRELLGATDPRVEVDETSIGNAPGQGFDAWAITKHNNGKPIVWLERVDVATATRPSWYDNDQEWFAALEDEERWYSKYPSNTYAYVDFDTAYGYRENGMNCTMLHASYIVRLFKEFAEPRGIDIYWRNEYTGEWYKNLDAAGLEDFLGGGDAAMEWFNTSVVPMMQRMVEGQK